MRYLYKVVFSLECFWETCVWGLSGLPVKSTGPQTKRDADSSVALPPKSYIKDFHHLSVAAPDRLDDASSVMAKARCTSVTVAEVGGAGEPSKPLCPPGTEIVLSLGPPLVAIHIPSDLVRILLRIETGGCIYIRIEPIRQWLTRGPYRELMCWHRGLKERSGVQQRRRPSCSNTLTQNA